jgi:hypothetical protein
MNDEQQDPRGADGAPDDEPEVDQPSAHKAEEVDKSIPTTDPTEGRNAAERTVQFGFAGLRAMPVIPPDLCRVVRKNQEDLAKTLRRFAAGIEEQLRAGAPPNWQFGNDWPKLTMLSEMVEQDGIPLAWVPRGDIVVALVDAEWWRSWMPRESRRGARSWPSVRRTSSKTASPASTTSTT